MLWPIFMLGSNSFEVAYLARLRFLDTDGSGAVSPKEFAKGLQRLEPVGMKSIR